MHHTGENDNCELCEKNGAPKWVYNNHNSNKCRKKDRSEKLISGGSTRNNFIEKEMKREVCSVRKKYQEEIVIYKRTLHDEKERQFFR